MRTKKLIPFLLLILVLAVSCKKNNAGGEPGANYSLSYGDSIIYLQNTAGDYKVSPITPMKGSYSAFPEGLEMDETTGEINVSESETGLRYRITFTPADGSRSYSTTVLLAGINYLDAFYILARNDTVSRAVYNADLASAVPVSPGKTVFDIGGKCSREGIAINPQDGSINLAKTIRNGFFGRHPDNDSREEFELRYKIDDKSGQSEHRVKIKLYYYDTMKDVDKKYFELLKEREGTLLWANNTTGGNEIISGVTGVNGISGRAAPRPPCIFIIGR
ncbi:MAG TPA: hypothetical protein VD996_18310 [Chitinophagaceae bacterium]|nr:hypothetical protein [Chitinophagaceae bacterium]